MNLDDEKRISDIYNGRLKEGLSDHKSVGWGSKESQYLRFKILTEIDELSKNNVLDVGCGLGELFNFFTNNSIKINSYKGIDISRDLILEAQNRFDKKKKATFEFINIDKLKGHEDYDYVFLSGALNLKVENNLIYAKKVIKKMYSLCRKGVACNFLSSYADFSLEKDYHYSPEEIFSYSKGLSSRAVLRHDYPLYEFTLYLYKD
jgi:SAM-dependent methyltransferase